MLFLRDDEKNNTKFSREIVKGFERAPSRAMLRGVGFKDKDFEIPQVGIASTWRKLHHVIPI